MLTGFIVVLLRMACCVLLLSFKFTNMDLVDELNKYIYNLYILHPVQHHQLPQLFRSPKILPLLHEAHRSFNRSAYSMGLTVAAQTNPTASQSFSFPVGNACSVSNRSLLCIPSDPYLVVLEAISSVRMAPFPHAGRRDSYGPSR